MFDYPIFQASPLLNALMQTLLLVLYPLVIALLAGGWISLSRFLKDYPALPVGKKGGTGPKGILLLSYGYAAVFPLLYLFARRFLWLSNGLSLVLLLALGGTFFMVGRLLGRLNRLDSAVLETALACGLNKGQLIQLILLPLGRAGVISSLCETAFFLLALSSFAGLMSGNGLAGLAVSTPNAGTFSICLALLLLLILLPVLIFAWSKQSTAK